MSAPVGRKLSPPSEDGRKHYTVRIWRWSLETSRVILAENATEARYLAVPRRGPGEYVIGAKRSTVAEVSREIAFGALGDTRQEPGK